MGPSPNSKIKDLIEELKLYQKSREMSLVITKLEEALLWLDRLDELESIEALKSKPA